MKNTAGLVMRPQKGKSVLNLCDDPFQKAFEGTLRSVENCCVKKLSGPQKSAFRSFVAGKVTFACLPTDHCNSLIYQLSCPTNLAPNRNHLACVARAKGNGAKGKGKGWGYLLFRFSLLPPPPPLPFCACYAGQQSP